MSVRGASGDAQMAFEDCGIGFQDARWRVLHDRSAFQYHNPVREPQNLLCVMFDDD
jgi:hypothetical protein